MVDIITETRTFIEAALAGDPAISSLIVTGSSAETLTATIGPGRPPAKLDRVSYSPQTPFLREQMVDLVERMQRSRWARFDSYTLALTPPTDADLDRLGEYDPMRQDASTMHCECGPGWYDLLDSVFAAATEAQPRSWWKVSQLKEKYGGLRLYHSGAPGDVEAMIDAAEHLSEHVCDVCGAPGKKGSDRGWITTRCEEHAE